VAQFPANREFYREFCDFEGVRADFVARNRCAAGTSQGIPYADYQGKYFEDQGIFKRYQGITM
jgi:hypothetical protein